MTFKAPWLHGFARFGDCMTGTIGHGWRKIAISLKIPGLQIKACNRLITTVNPAVSCSAMREQIRKALDVLIEKPLWSSGRAADLEWFAFGERRTVKGL